MNEAMGGKSRRKPERERSTDVEREELEALVGECERSVEELMNELVDSTASFEDYERKLLEMVHEVVRRKLEKKLQQMADGYAERLDIEHNTDWHGWRETTRHRYRRHAPGTVTYHSLVGPLRVNRWTYRECGTTSTHVPLELDAGLLERMTPALARWLAISYAHMPSRQCEQALQAALLRPPSRSTLDRCARDLGSYALAANAEIEPAVRAEEVVPDEAQVIVLGMDRTSVPMREDGGFKQRGDYESEPRTSRPKPTPRRPNEPVVWKMDFVGTVSLLDEQRRPLAIRKYRLPADADPTHIAQRMLADVRHALDQRPELSIAVVQDGAPQLWTLLGRALAQEPAVSQWTEVLDWYHVDERLTQCLNACGHRADARSRQRARWRAHLLEHDDGVRKLCRSLRRAKRRLEPAARAELDRHIAYFRTNRERMRYRMCRSQGLPIGSGATEGACKSVVAVRAKRSGQRWSQRGLSAALHLRTLHDSDRFDAYWPRFAARYRATCIEAIRD